MRVSCRLVIIILSCLLAAATARQQPLVVHQVDPFTPYDAGLFTPFEDLHALSVVDYTVLQHPSFPSHSVRIKQSHFCDGEVRAYTGYIDVEARHLFFYFFESRRDPDTDDVIFWTNGGPGASSSLGLFMELGPCRVTGPKATERFEYAWNEHANVFFVDQPVGVGFSYAEYGEQVSSTAEAAKDISAFMIVFFEHFSKFKGRPFHFAGESYGGRYLPVFAATVYDRNAELVEAGLTPINLTSVMIGNGATDYIGNVRSYYDLMCKDYGFPEIASISDCVRMKQLLPRCEKRFQQSCIDVQDSIDCADAWQFCYDSFAWQWDYINPYDHRKLCKGHPGGPDCYTELQDIAHYLNDPETQVKLGVDRKHGNFTSWLNWDLFARFAPDYWSFRAEHYLAALLERGVRVLIYVGETDWGCNWVANERMTLGLEWTQQELFRSQSLREWFVDGEAAGKTRTAGPLTFATVHDAGHMVPYDQPVRALQLANRWLADEEL